MKRLSACVAIVAALAWLAQSTPVIAQAAVVGNATIAATTASANVALPNTNTTRFPALVIVPATGTTVEIFYLLGVDNTVAAISTPGATQSPAVPPGGICINIGSAKFIAAITGSSTATLRITQMSTCPILGKLQGPAVPPPTCSNALDFSQACNSQFLAFLRL